MPLDGYQCGRRPWRCEGEDNDNNCELFVFIINELRIYRMKKRNLTKVEGQRQRGLAHR
jgi:hypothetical protein